MKTLQTLLIIIVAVLIAHMILASDNVKNKQYGEPAYTIVTTTYDYSDMVAAADLGKNKCINEATGFEAQVVFEELPDNIIGQWRTEGHVIALESISIDTIAHEVHHMVDYMSQMYGLDDEHEAYLQGQFTECVYNIVMDEVAYPETEE